MASNAIGRGGVLAGDLQGSMALPADCRIVAGGFLAARRPMWVVTGLARQPACARGKTPGLTQPVYGTYRLEFVVVSRSGRMIEFDHTQKIFTNPKDKRTEDYVTGRFG